MTVKHPEGEKMKNIAHTERRASPTSQFRVARPPRLERFDRLIKQLPDNSSVGYIIGRPDLTVAAYSAAEVIRIQNAMIWRQHWHFERVKNDLQRAQRKAARKPFRWPWSAPNGAATKPRTTGAQDHPGMNQE